MVRKFSFFWLALIISASVAASQGIQTPSQYTGVEVGADYQLIDYNQIVDYLCYLESQSPRIRLENLGETTMGNPFYVAILSSEENIRKLDRIREIQARLSDPRKLSEQEAEALIREGKTVVLLNCAIHSTEIASTQMATILAYNLVTATDPVTREILENVVILLVPAHNPDGQLMVTNWYRKYVHTPFENAPMPFLYHKYVGHDNNRDWFMLTQKETRITVEKLHLTWHPQIVHDLHQMGSSGARFFVPPYIDPIEPNVHPLLISQINMLGETIAAELLREGKTGVVTNAIFDAWTPARAFQHYHGGVRILTEAASARIASPVEIPFEKLRGRGNDYDPKKRSVHFPRPWPGGTWRLKDIIEYELIAVMAELKHAARFREEWLKTFYRIHKENCSWSGKPYAFVIPNDPRKQTEIAELLDVLMTGGVEVYKATRKEEIGGITLSTGDYVIPLAQPYGPFAKALMERQQYPALLDSKGRLKRPYDMTSHNLPLLMGIRIDSIMTKPAQKLQPVVKNEVQPAVSVPEGGRWLAMDPASYGADILAILLEQNGISIFRLQSATEIKGKTFPPGTYVLKRSSKADKLIRKYFSRLPVLLEKLDEAPKGAAWKVRRPRIGLYHGYVPSMDQGWTRWIFEHYGILYEKLGNKDIRKINRKKLDVVIFADYRPASIVRGFQGENVPPEYRGGIGKEGLKALKHFVEQGGTLIAWGNSVQTFVDAFDLKVKNAVKGLKPEEFYVPGSLLRVKVARDVFIGYGYPEETVIFFVRGPVFEAQQGRALARFVEKDPLAMGWLTGPDKIVGKPVALEVPMGKGRVVLFAFRPQFRAQARNSYKFLMNAIQRAAAQKASL
jgi:hypothetical protein